jgi:hypothetical protein
MVWGVFWEANQKHFAISATDQLFYFPEASGFLLVRTRKKPGGIAPARPDSQQPKIRGRLP